jgi:hypothetical protein
MIKILLQTTIPATSDDWSVARFSLLTRLLREHLNEDGEPLFDVTARDREVPGLDSVLSTLDRSDFDQMWLFAVDEGNGLNADECRAISDFRRSGRGLMVTRDHMDLGSSICSLAGVGAAHHFHTRNKGPTELQMRDDPHSKHISWPNFHSGANGDYQIIHVLQPTHAVLRNPSSPTGTIRYLPAHPHEGAVSAPIDEDARVIAGGRSKTTGRPFNIAVAFEADRGKGRAIAQSTFHHFADYNWDTQAGAPSFVDEPPSTAIMGNPEATDDAHRYALNIARWLSGENK